MRETTEVIVLNVIRHNDSHNIAHVYSERFGLLSVLVRQGRTASARARNAMFMPLSLLEMVVTTSHGQDLARIADVRRTSVLLSLHTDPLKMSEAMFVAEVLGRVIVEHERNDALYSFLRQSVTRLDACERGAANFHIAFLYQLGRYVGIQPDVATYNEGSWFDMDDGVFQRGAVLGHRCLPPAEGRVIHLLSRMSYDNMHLFRFTRQQRVVMLETILAYYRLHHSALGSLRSLDVLKQLFA